MPWSLRSSWGGPQVGSADGFPLLLANTVSMHIHFMQWFIFYPGCSAVWPQCWLCAVCAVGHVGCCVRGGWAVPCGGKQITIVSDRWIESQREIPCRFHTYVNFLSYHVRWSWGGPQVGFADGFPLLLANILVNI